MEGGGGETGGLKEKRKDMRGGEKEMDAGVIGV